jgi:hypothetical protein
MMENANYFDNLAVMVDCSRNAVRTVETLKTFMRAVSQMGYTSIWLYMEDVYEIPEEPYFGHKRGRYSQKELKEITAYARELGLKCIPAIQTLAHLNGITRWRRFNPSVLDIDDILFADEPQTYELIEKMFKALRECFDGEEINIGMDEAYRVGLGRYMTKHGYTDRASIIVKHLKKVVEIAGKYGFNKPIMWNDMFVRLANKGEYLKAESAEISKEIMDMIPENITLACWNYYSFDKKFYQNMLSMQQKFNRPLYYTSGAISWLGVTPMNKYSIKQNSVAIRACKEKGVKNYTVAIWGDDGAECSLFATLPTLAYIAAQAKGEKEYKTQFKENFGVSFDNFLRLDMPNDVIKPAKMFAFSQAARYMLYNDCLQGLYDSTITEGDGEKFKSVALKLGRLAKKGEWAYLFKTQAALSRTLYYKYELTAKTRNAYLARDKETLRAIVDNDYKKVLKNLDEYYEAFRYQWYKENKPQGFEVQDYRIGGLKQRLLNCKRVIEEYLDGKIERIAELEEPVLSVVCNEEMDGMGVDARTIKEVITANVFSHN